MALGAERGAKTPLGPFLCALRDVQASNRPLLDLFYAPIICAGCGRACMSHQLLHRDKIVSVVQQVPRKRP